MPAEVRLGTLTGERECALLWLLGLALQYSDEGRLLVHYFKEAGGYSVEVKVDSLNLGRHNTTVWRV